MKTKLTLRLDDAVIARAKAYAAARGTSVSGLVEDYFRLVAADARGDGGPPAEADWRRRPSAPRPRAARQRRRSGPRKGSAKTAPPRRPTVSTSLGSTDDGDPSGPPSRRRRAASWSTRTSCSTCCWNGRPFVADSARLLAAVVERRVVGVLAGHAVTTVYYVYRRGRPREVARQKVAVLLSAFEVAPVGARRARGRARVPVRRLRGRRGPRGGRGVPGRRNRNPRRGRLLGRPRSRCTRRSRCSRCWPVSDDLAPREDGLQTSGSAGVGPLQGAASAARGFAERAKSENTKRAYRADWRCFRAWCAPSGGWTRCPPTSGP